MNLRYWIWSFLTLLVLAPCARPQGSEGRITGTVTDPAGAVIPAVGVVATNEETGVQVRAQANETGLYVLPFLTPGRYTITATSTGFKTYARKGIVVETSQVMQLNIPMEIGGATESITVTGEAPLLQSSQSTIDQFIDSRTVSDMPLGGRRALELVRLSSDAVFVTYSGDAKPQFAVAGGRSYKAAYMLDGGNIQNLRMASLQVDIDPPVEVIKEFRVVQNGYSAEYGSSGSGVLISTTKSGTNEIHGSAFEFFRNDKLDAAGFFAPAEGNRKLKAPLRYNLFGGTVGGPIIRNRTHFFAGYEGTRKSDGSTQIMTLPTSAQNAGDFSQTTDARGAVIAIYDPATTQVSGGKTIRLPFAGNVIPSNRIDPVAKALAQYWPAPNRAPSNLAGAQNFAGNRANKFTRDNVTTRVDHVFSDANRFYFRLVYNRDPYAWTSNYPGTLGDPQFPISPTRWETSYLVKDTHTLSPNLIVDGSYSFSNRRWYANSAGNGSGVVEKVGLPGVSKDAFPAIVVAGIANLGSSNERIQSPIRQHQIANSWTWVKSNHVMKFGGEWRKGVNVDINRPIISGQYNFANTGTGLPGDSRTGVAYASYLLGFVNAFSLRETEVLDRYNYYYAWFAQDDWKAMPSLTLNLGVRWETDTPIMDRNNRMNGFDPYQINPVSGTPGVVKFAGVNGWRVSQYPTDWNNFGPRFGFAWKPFNSDKWVVRGGYGIFYEGPSITVNAASLGFELSASTSSPDSGITPAHYLKNGPGVSLTKGKLDDAFGAVQLGKAVTTNVTYYDPGRRTGYAQHINLGIQRTLPGNMVLEVRYNSNLSHKLPAGNLNINQVRPELMMAGNAQSRRPFPQFNTVQILNPTIGNNTYHAGTVRVEKRTERGLAFQAGYTWSRAIGDTDNTSGDLGDSQVYQDLYNRGLDKGPDALDIVHRFVWSSTYDLPVGKNRRWLTKGVLSQVIGGWTVGSIATLQSGGPFTVTTQTNTTNAFSSGGQRANLLRNPNLPTDQRTVNRWFDTEAFENPAQYRFGNAGRGVVRADGRINFDFSINKNVFFGEKRLVQLRGDLFNAFNHPDFFLPNRVLGAANFGTIGGATDGRTVQFGLRVQF